MTLLTTQIVKISSMASLSTSRLKNSRKSNISSKPWPDLPAFKKMVKESHTRSPGTTPRRVFRNGNEVLK
jgi:hypothetical protein